MRGTWHPAPTPTALDQSPRPSLTSTPGTCAELGSCAEQSGGAEAGTSRAGRAGGAPAPDGPAAESGRRRRRGAPDTLSEQATRDFKARQSSDTPLRYTRTPEPSGATAAEMAAATEAMVAKAAAKVEAEAAAAKVAAEAAAQPMSCVAWRQTSGCSPTGRREPQGDKARNAMLQPDASQAAAPCNQASTPCNPRRAAPPLRPAPRVHASAEASPIVSCAVCGGRHATIRPSRAPPRANSPVCIAAAPPHIQAATTCVRTATVCIQVRRRVPACSALRVRLVARRPGLHRRRPAAAHRRPGAGRSRSMHVHVHVCKCMCMWHVHTRAHVHT